MGQIFYACAYDMDSKECCVVGADKFHANCYSYSGAVLSMHYLLRQKPYHVMWGGDYIVLDDSIKDLTRNEQLLGISTYTTYEDFDCNNNDIQQKDYYDKVKFIGDNVGQWEKIDVWDESVQYFDWENTHSVKYSGYLVNHSKKIAVDLEKYYETSRYLNNKGLNVSIDLVPVLTETGGGTPMAMFDGVSIDTTEELAGEWCGDLLQIIDTLPEDYELIHCCFAECYKRASYCDYTFGINEQGYILKDRNGGLYEAVVLKISRKRGLSYYFKVEKTEDKMKIIPVLVEGNMPAIN